MSPETIFMGLFFFVIIFGFIVGMFMFPELFGISKKTDSTDTSDNKKP